MARSISGKMIKETPKARLIQHEVDGFMSEDWIPKSKTSHFTDMGDETVAFTVPEWLWNKLSGED